MLLAENLMIILPNRNYNNRITNIWSNKERVA